MFKFYHQWILKLHPKWQYLIKEWIEPILLAILLALIIRTFFFQAYKIPTGSMRPTLMENDRVLVNKFIYHFHEPKRSDIIVFRYPGDGKKRDFIKRLVGLPGDEIEIKQGKIYIDGESFPEDSVFRKFYYYNREDWEYGGEDKKILVPENSFFVLGDNSAQSSDSRNWGFVKRKELIGKAFMIYWPPKRIRLVK